MSFIELIKPSTDLINVEFMQVVEASENSINHLVINDSALETIRALASRRHKATENWSVDFIEGKGVGQIILLHGPPGVGKTYTVGTQQGMR